MGKLTVSARNKCVIKSGSCTADLIMQLLSERLHDHHFNSVRKPLQELCQSTAKCCEEVGMVIYREEEEEMGPTSCHYRIPSPRTR